VSAIAESVKCMCWTYPEAHSRVRYGEKENRVEVRFPRNIYSVQQNCRISNQKWLIGSFEMQGTNEQEAATIKWAFQEHTFTASFCPPKVFAEWTWASDALASGTRSNSSNTYHTPRWYQKYGGYEKFFTFKPWFTRMIFINTLTIRRDMWSSYWITKIEVFRSLNSHLSSSLTNLSAPHWQRPFS